MRNANQILSDILEAYEAWAEYEPEPTVDVSSKKLLIDQAAGHLWRVRDFMPNSLRRNVLELIRHGETPRTETSLATYAQAARIVKRRIDETRAA